MLKPEEKKKKQAPAQDEPDELDDYMEMPSHEPLNTAASVFDAGINKKTGGINTAPSVFDKSAVFKVTKSD
jgi:hypothetical protein